MKKKLIVLHTETSHVQFWNPYLATCDQLKQAHFLISFNLHVSSEQNCICEFTHAEVLDFTSLNLLIFWECLQLLLYFLMKNSEASLACIGTSAKTRREYQIINGKMAHEMYWHPKLLVWVDI